MMAEAQPICASLVLGTSCGQCLQRNDTIFCNDRCYQSLLSNASAAYACSNYCSGTIYASSSQCSSLTFTLPIILLSLIVICCPVAVCVCYSMAMHFARRKFLSDASSMASLQPVPLAHVIVYAGARIIDDEPTSCREIVLAETELAQASFSTREEIELGESIPLTDFICSADDGPSSRVDDDEAKGQEPVIEAVAMQC
jgi:hypothetical protein